MDRAEDRDSLASLKTEEPEADSAVSLKCLRQRLSDIKTEEK